MLPWNGNYHEAPVDWLICRIKEALKEWENIQKQFNDLNEAFNDLKAYVMGFFDSGNLAIYVNNWLDNAYENGKLETLLGGKVLFHPEYFPFTTLSNGTLNQILECASTYYVNNDKLYYDNYYTAVDLNVNPTDGMKNGKYQIDCSSFLELILLGTDFNASRYNGNANNEHSRPYSFQWYKDVNEAKTRKYTYDLAEWFYKNGYSFEANENFSNLRPGDVCYFCFDVEHHPDKFRNIDHCALFLGRYGADNYCYFIEVGEQENPVRIQSYSDSLMNTSWRMGVRIPMIDCTFEKENICSDGTYEALGTTSSLITAKWLNEDLIANKWYTIEFEALLNGGAHIFIDMGGTPNVVFPQIAEKDIGVYKKYHRTVYMTDTVDHNTVNMKFYGLNSSNNNGQGIKNVKVYKGFYASAEKELPVYHTDFGDNYKEFTSSNTFKNFLIAQETRGNYSLKPFMAHVTDNEFNGVYLVEFIRVASNYHAYIRNLSGGNDYIFKNGTLRKVINNMNIVQGKVSITPTKDTTVSKTVSFSNPLNTLDYNVFIEPISAYPYFKTSVSEKTTNNFKINILTDSDVSTEIEFQYLIIINIA